MPRALGVERGGRLVGEDDARTVGERPGDRHALGLAAGQLGGKGVLAMADLEIVQQLDSPACVPRRLVPRQLQHHRHVVGGVEERQQVVELEDEADLLQPQPAQIAPQPAAVVDQLAVQAHASARRIEDAADDVEQRGLARAGRAAQGDHLAGAHVERDVAQGIDAGLPLAEMLGDAAQARPARCRAWRWSWFQLPSAVAGSTLSAARTPRALASRQTRTTTPPSASTLSGSSTTRRGK